MNTLLLFLCATLLCIAPVSTVSAQSHASKPGLFIENKGQIRDRDGKLRPEIAFTAQSPGMQMFFSAHSIHYTLLRNVQPANPTNTITSVRSADDRVQEPPVAEVLRVDMNMVGANRDVRILPEGKTSEYCNFYYAHCPNGIENVGTYERLVYRNVYDHIDMVAYRQGGGLKYDFVVHPGGNVSDIRLKYDGVQAVSLTQEGGVEVATLLGVISEQKPVLYQPSTSARRAVKGRFVVEGGEVRFDVEHYDRDQDLVIDPEVMWSTYIGGEQSDITTMIANAGNSGDLVATGETVSVEFPVTPGAVQETRAGRRDLFIARYSYGGEQLWATYYGGSETEGGRSIGGIAVAGNGDIAVVGATESQDFPVTPDAFQREIAGQFDMAIIKMDGAGHRQWATYYGGNSNDYGYVVKFDSQSNIVISGETSSLDFPVSPGAFQEQYGGANSDAFVVKLSGDGSPLWATYCGGGERYWELGFDVAVDKEDNIVLTGSTGSSDFPVSPGAFQGQYAGGDFDIFITKFSPTGGLLWSTFYGGRYTDESNGVAIDSNNNIIITGISRSADFPVSNNAWQKQLRNQPSDYEDYYDVVILKFAPDGKRLWGTYYGGAVADVSNKVAVDGDNNIWVVGFTESRDIPITDNALQKTYGGRLECFILNMNADGALLWATYYGGDGNDNALSVAAGDNSGIAVAGYTSSTNFPVKNAFQNQHGGGENDGFILRFGTCELFDPAVVAEGPTSFCEGGEVVLQAEAGYAAYSWSTGENSSSIVVSRPGTYTVRVQDNSGCWGVSKPITVVVRPLPRPVITVSGALTLCEGESLVLFAPAGFASYRWSNGATASSITVSAAGSFRVVVSDEWGCTGGSASVDVTVVPRPHPDITVLGSPTPCEGETVVLTAPEGFTSYRWSNGATTRSISVHTAGVYSVEVDAGGCTGTSATVRIDFFPAGSGSAVEVASALTDGSFVLESPLYYQLGCSDIVLRNTAGNPLLISSAFCVVNTKFSVPQGQFPLLIAPRSTTTLTVCYVPEDVDVRYDTLVVGDQCSSVRIPLASRGKRAEIDAVVTGKCNVGLVLKSLPTADGMLVVGKPYPNPASEELFVPVELQGVGNVAYPSGQHCRLVTMLGISVAEGTYERTPGDTYNSGLWRIDTALIPAGLYTLFLRTDEGIVTCPVIIAR